MRPTNFRAKVIREARRDAAAYVREFRRLFVLKDIFWVTEAWADLRRDFKLAPDVAGEHRPVNWEEGLRGHPPGLRSHPPERFGIRLTGPSTRTFRHNGKSGSGGAIRRRDLGAHR